MVVAPEFGRKGKAWRPARLEGLPRLSRDDAALALRLEGVFPEDQRAQLVEAIRSRVEDVAQEKVQLDFEEIALKSHAALQKELSDPALLATLSLAPHLPRALLEVELGLSHALVDLLLGGAGETVALRALSDIEEGVVSFVLLEALRAVSGVRGTDVATIQLESMLRTSQDAMAMLSTEGPILVFQVRVTVGTQPGHARLAIPLAALPQGRPSLSGPRFAASVAAHLGRLSSVRTELRCSVGHAELTLADVRALGPGDVVLVESPTARPDRGEGGTGWLEVGRGRRAHIESELALGDSVWQVTLKAFHPGEKGWAGKAPGAAEEAAGEALEAGLEAMPAPPPEAPETSEVTHPQEEASIMSGTGGEGSELLGDVPLQLSVELARIPMTADQVVALRIGQVVELHRGANEPVELTINGKAVARGELVEIEGQLGVRVQSLVG